MNLVFNGNNYPFDCNFVHVGSLLDILLRNYFS